MVQCLLVAWGLFGFDLWVSSCHAGDTDAAKPNSEAIEFFERKIRPVLVDRCYECHSSQSDLIQGGLRVDDTDAMIRGGDSGSAIKPGKPQDSLLLTALRYDGMEMPPDEPLPENVVRDFEAWIRAGAVMPDMSPGTTHDVLEDSGTIDWDSARQFWAFQSPSIHDPREIDPGSTIDPSWPSTKLDGFVQRRLAFAGLSPNRSATKREWLRRVTFDLIGLPPTMAELQQFLADRSPMAKARVVDRLLSSPENAERWTRAWLDLARFAEDQAHIVGSNDSLTYPNAYLYRDWVIEAFSGDLPYDQFIRQQLAADLIYPDDPSKHVALGFIGLGPKYYRRGDLAVMADEWEDRIDTVSRGLLGLTVACARCHDHKYDPIPTTDYYALAGVFASTEMYNRPLDDSVEKKGDQAKKPQDAVHIVREGSPMDLSVMIRGDAKRLGDSVSRGYLTVLGRSDAEAFQQGSGRAALAEAIVDPAGPLAARVIVNRVWGQLMGKPIVDTPSNFGELGSRPTHPLLLDDLAVRFVRSGWSLKWLQREIVLSATYGQSSEIDPVKSEADPANQLRWRMPRRRLELEAYRDAVLVAAGRLDRTLGGPSIDPQDVDSTRRTVYSEVSRLDLNPMLARFDFPDPNSHSARRHETTTPLQKLFLLNSPFMTRNAEAFSQRIKSAASNDTDRIRFAYQSLFCREPSVEEHDLALSFVSQSGRDGWANFAQALLISNEMLMLD